MHDGGFIATLHLMKEKHAGNETVLAALNDCLNTVNPNAATIITQMLENIKNESLINHYLGDICKKIVIGDESLNPEQTTEALSKLWEVYKNDLKIGKLLSNTFVQMTTSPTFMKPLIDCSLVESMVDAATENPDYINDALTAINNLSMIPEGVAYLQGFNATDKIVKMMLKDESNDKGKIESIRALTHIDADIDHLISLGMINNLQNIIDNSDSIILKTEALGLLNTMIGKCTIDEPAMDPESMMQWCGKIAGGIDNKIVQQLCDKISFNCTQLMPQMNTTEAIQASEIQAVTSIPEPTDMIDEMMIEEEAETHFQKGLDQRFDYRTQEEALDKFLQSEVTQEQIDNMASNHAIDRIVSAMKGAKDANMQAKLIDTLSRVAGGDPNFGQFVAGGGVQALMHALNGNLNDPNVLFPGLGLVGLLAQDNRMKTLLGMHNVIQLILECMRRHPMAIELLNKCCFALGHLAYNNSANVTTIVELGGVSDIIALMDRHVNSDGLMATALDLICNLCHNSDKNKTMICISGGGQCVLNALYMHQGRDYVVSSGFRALGNLAFVPDNVPKLVKLNAVKVIVECMTANLRSENILQMGAAVLSNMAADQRVSAAMVSQGVLNVIINVSCAYPDLIELQKSCLVCMGNLINMQENAQALMEAQGHKRIFDIMDSLDFEEHIVHLCLQLVKMLCISSDVSTSLTEQGATEHVVTVIGDNMKNETIVRKACEALCKLIVTETAAIIVSGQSPNIVDTLVMVAKEGKNHKNGPLMVDIMKVFQNMCIVEANAQAIARHGAVPILKGIEIQMENQVFLNVATTLIGNLGVYPTASRHLVKRGACPVLIECLKKNIYYRGIAAKIVRCVANFILTDAKAHEQLEELQTESLVNQALQQHPNHNELKKAAIAFQKAMKMKSKKMVQKGAPTLSLKDKIDTPIVRMLHAGTIMRKFCKSAKPRKRKVYMSDDLQFLIFEDPTGKKSSKQMQTKTITDVRRGACTYNLKRGGMGWKPALEDRCFAIFSIDPNQNEFTVDLEAKSPGEFDRWTKAIDMVRLTAQGKNIDNINIEWTESTRHLVV